MNEKVASVKLCKGPHAFIPIRLIYNAPGYLYILGSYSPTPPPIDLMRPSARARAAGSYLSPCPSP